MLDFTPEGTQKITSFVHEKFESKIKENFSNPHVQKNKKKQSENEKICKEMFNGLMKHFGKFVLDTSKQI